MTAPMVAMRSEVEVCADAVVALVIAGLLGRDLPTLAKSAEAVGIPLGAVHDAIGRHERHQLAPPLARPVFATRPDPVATERIYARPSTTSTTTSTTGPFQESTYRPSSGTAGRMHRPEPPHEEESVVCAGCDRERPAVAFSWRLGRAVGRCSSCRARSQIRQGMQVDRLRRRGEWLDAVGMEWTAGPECRGLHCRPCGKPIEEGQGVRCEGELWHVHCSGRA